MSEQGFPPQPPVPPTPEGRPPGSPPPAAQSDVPPIAGSPLPPQMPYPPQASYPPPAPGYPPPGGYYPPPRRSRAWIGWTIGIVVVLFLVIGSCMLPLMLLAPETGTRMGTGFGDSVAVIHVDGVIAGTGGSGIITPEAFLDMLQQAEDDDSVKALVLRVDSPGGTVAASEEISRYVESFGKPVVVSVGDIGASGAYMVSSQADEIMALPGSAVGSIGVIAEIPNVAGLLDKVGVQFQTIHAGKYKDTGSPYRPLTEEETKLIQGEVDEAYDQFIDIVAKGRKMTRSEVETLATGQTWSGDKAKELGLVDSIGTYQDALDSAALRGGIEGDYDVVTFEDEFDQIFGSLLGATESLARLSEANNVGSTGREALPK